VAHDAPASGKGTRRRLAEKACERRHRAGEAVQEGWAYSLGEARYLCRNMLSRIKWTVSQGRGIFGFGRSAVGADTQRCKERSGGGARPLHTEHILLNGASVPDQGTIKPTMQFGMNLRRQLRLRIAGLLDPRLVAQLA